MCNISDVTNPGVTFHRMKEPATYPSAPSKPVHMNVTETSITLQWVQPRKQGASPISGYLLQYYSPEIGQVAYYNICTQYPNKSSYQMFT